MEPRLARRADPTLHFPKNNLTVAVAVTEQSQYGAIFGVVGAVGRMLFAPQ